MINRRESESGYSLVEVLAAIVILTLAIIPMVTMFDTGLRSATTSGNYDKARALANANLEQIKAGQMPSDDGSEVCPVPPQSSTLSCSIEKVYVALSPAGSDSMEFLESADQTGMMKITVTVRWGDGSDYNVTGLVAK